MSRRGSMCSMSNYPDSVRIGDPNAPWNRGEEPHLFRVTVEVEVWALNDEHAADKARDAALEVCETASVTSVTDLGNENDFD